MSRIALLEPVFVATNPASYGRGRRVYVYLRGSEELATLYAAESGADTIAQPLFTDSGGRPEDVNGQRAWVESGRFDLAIETRVGSDEYVRVPWEAAEGGASGGGVSPEALEEAISAEESARNSALTTEQGDREAADAGLLASHLLRNPHIDPREYGAAADSNGEAENGTDDTEALENAIAAAIEQKRPLFIPGKMRVAGGLVVKADNFEMFGLGRGLSKLVADDSSFHVLTIGPGEEGSGSMRGGYARGFEITGGNADITAAGAEPDTGKAALLLDGIRLFEVGIGVSGAHDIAFDLRNNCFGSRFVHARAALESCRVGLNLRTEDQSGADLSFFDCWLAGEVAAVHITDGKNYRFWGGQFSASRQATEDDDDRGVLILGKDYLGGESKQITDVTLVNSFEYFKHCWAIRAFNRVNVHAHSSFNAGGGEAPAIGFFKNSKHGVSIVRLDTCGFLSSEFSKPASEIVVLEADTSDASWQEDHSWGTYTDGTGEENALWEPIGLRADVGGLSGTKSGGYMMLGSAILRKNGAALEVSFDGEASWKKVKAE